MGVVSCLSLVGGLALFFVGMAVLSRQLRKLAGGRLEDWLGTLTGQPLRGFILGIGLSVALQSSSAVTVLLAGLGSAGMLRLRQAAPVIMGCNIGTTLTVWLFALTDLPSGGVWPMQPENFLPLLALVGSLIGQSASPRCRAAGRGGVGLALLLGGMELMQRGAAPLGTLPQFQAMLTALHRPMAGLLAGAAFTGVIQSSAASMAILQALTRSGSWTVRMALPVIWGQNIGTCSTAALAAMGAGRGAWRIAAFHAAFNLAGSAVWMALFIGIDALARPACLDAPIHAAGIALCHTLFNLSTAALFAPMLLRRSTPRLRSVPAAKGNASFSKLK